MAVVKNLKGVVKNNMFIILKRIPKKTHREDISLFLAPALKGGLFQKSGSIQDIKFYAKENNKSFNLEYYGVVSIDPDASAEKVIKKLNRKPLLGKYIEITEYKYRLWQNDPREDLEVDVLEILGKRACRRKSGLKDYEPGPMDFSTEADFERKK